MANFAAKVRNIFDLSKYFWLFLKGKEKKIGGECATGRRRGGVQDLFKIFFKYCV
jgi:hypothetical protein